jgi:uncharacterized protein (TIGR03086 family)
MPALDFEPATSRLAKLVEGVADSQLGDPTPCADTSVAALLDHIHGLAQGLALAGTKELHLRPTTDGPPQASADNLVDDWRTDIPVRLEGLAEAWRRPESWTGMTKAGGVDLPGEVCGLVALDEVVIHGWDLAVATGQAYEVDPNLLEAVHGWVAAFEPPPDAAGGLFGPRVPVPDDAPLLDRTLGLTGRDPSWSPA